MSETKENSEIKLKQLRAARGYTKSSISRLYFFVSNEQDVGLSNLFNLQTKRARIVELFKEYESYNKQILALDDEDHREDVLDVEGKYFHILTVLNEAIKDKSMPSPEASTFKAKLPKIDINIFTDTYTSRAYQFERSDEDDPTVNDFLMFLEKRALALENAEPSTSGKARKAAVNITTTPGAGSCSHCKCRFHFRCKICKDQAHNTVLHDNTASEQPVSLMSNVSSDRVLLPTVKVKLYAQNGREVHLKAILDSASQISIVTSADPRAAATSSAIC